MALITKDKLPLTLCVVLLLVVVLITAVAALISLLCARKYKNSIKKSLQKSSEKLTEASGELSEAKETLELLQTKISTRREAVEGYKECVDLTQQKTEDIIRKTKDFKRRMESNKKKQDNIDKIYTRLIEAETKSYAEEEQFLLKREQDVMSSPLPRSKQDGEKRRERLISSRRMERKTRNLTMGYATGEEELPCSNLTVNKHLKIEKSSSDPNLSARLKNLQSNRKKYRSGSKLGKRMRKITGIFSRSKVKGINQYNCPSPLTLTRVGDEETDSPSFPSFSSSDDSVSSSCSEILLGSAKPIDYIVEFSRLDSDEDEMSQNEEEMRFRLSLSELTPGVINNLSSDQNQDEVLNSMCQKAQENHKFASTL